jgi:sucrose-6-phosphate hydrolase SacC (GH32 family)
MSWGHATSPDLVTWTERPVAIPYDANEGVFSGSAVLDTHNTSGFGTAENPPLVAVYTSAYTRASGREGIQAQSLAYSTDNGMTWTKYADNPVLDLDSREFRDPKVFWYEPDQSWRMVVALPTQHKVSIYSSPNLKDWSHLSDFGGRGAQSGVWECPDLFPLAVDGDPAKTKWVMVASLNPGSIAGGSGTQYFVGDFDGRTFRADGDGSYTPPAGEELQGFESGYAGWSPSGAALGDGPASGTLPGQQQVSGFLGSGLVNTFVDGDRTTGTLTSPQFPLSQRYLNFLIGGGRHPYQEGRSRRGVDPVGDVLADFETGDWGGWTASGGLVGGTSATGPLPGQLPVSEYRGQRFVNTFLDGDATTGRLTSPAFTVTRSRLNLLIGGGRQPWGEDAPTAVVLKVGNQVVRSATGTDSETLAWQTWDVSEFAGRTAQLEVVDENSGGFGHILLDQVVQSDDVVRTFADFEGHSPALPSGWSGTGEFTASGPSSPGLPGQQGLRVIDTCVVPDRCDTATGSFVSPTFRVEDGWINFLVAGGRHPWGQSSPTVVNLVVDGEVVRTATGPHAGNMDWVTWDVRDLAGRDARIEIVDGSSSGDWGHLMVDSVVFSSRAADPRSNATAVNLLVDGTVVRTATGQDSEHLDWVSWDLKGLEGKTARIQVVDEATGGWGHILADQFTLAAAPARSEVERAQWLDYGRDNYAGVTFNNAPDGRRVLIGWMSNWQYAGALPTSPWRGQMTLPRELSLVSTPAGPQLSQRPVGALAKRWAAAGKSRQTFAQPGASLTFNETALIEVQVDAAGAAEAGIAIRSGDGSEVTRIHVATDPNRLVVDRQQSGQVGFDPLFPSTESAPLAAGATTLRILVDRSSVEVFAQDGQRAITDLLFPSGGRRTVELVSEGGQPAKLRATVTPISR